MSAQRINELLALPWPDLAATFAEMANTQVNCVLSDDWHMDTGKVTRHYAGVKVAYRLQMRLDAADFTSSITSPPGYRRLSNDRLVGAAPLRGTWSGGIVTGFTSRFRAWVEGGRVLDMSPQLTESLEAYGFRAKADIKLNTTEPARPRLKDAQVSFRIGLWLKGLINKSIGPATVGAEFDPPETFRLLFPLDVPVATLPLHIPDLPKIGFKGNLELTLTPELEIGYDGALKIKFFEAKVLGKKIKIEGSVPFKFRVNLKVPGPKPLQKLLASVDVPRDWGEHPPPILRQAQLPPPNFDFLTPALDVEEAVLPNAVLGAPDDAADGPYHAPHGLIYEIRWFCGGPPNYDRIGHGTHHPPKPLYETYQDTAIWSGHFLAAESFRYAVTHSSDDLARVRFILDGIHKLFQVTKVSGLPARAALQADAAFDTDPPMCSSTQTKGTPCKPGRFEEYYCATIDGDKWCGFGRGQYPPSRDSYIGLMMGMAYAWALVPDSAVRKQIFDLVTAALNNLVLEHRWNVHTPGTPPQPIKTSFLHEFCTQLALLRLGKTVNPGAFGKLYDHFAEAADFCWVPEWGGTWDPLTKYYGLNLSHGALGILLFLENDEELRSHYKFAFAMIRRTVRHHRNPYFNLVRIITELPADRLAAINEPAGFAPHMTLGQETRLLLQEWLIRKQCIPGPLGLPTERSPDPEFLLNLLKPHAPNPAVKYTPVGSIDPNKDLVSKFALPVHKRPGTDFMWQRTPFATDIFKCDGKAIVDAGSPELEAPGIDYLLPFWMAAYLKIVAGA